MGEVLTTPPLEKTLLRNIHKARYFLWRLNYIRRSLGIFTPYPILCGW
jgi:hypothetical protein